MRHGLAEGLSGGCPLPNLRTLHHNFVGGRLSSSVFRVVAGHNIKDEDARYIERNPFYVSDACDAVYEHYFGSEHPTQRRDAAPRRRFVTASRDVRSSQ